MTHHFPPAIVLAFCSVLAATGASADPPPTDPLVIQSDSGTRGGHVSLEALPSPGSNNSLKKTFHVESLEHVQSAELLIFGALRDPTDRASFAFDTWEWIFFNLNGHGWVQRVEDVPMHRKMLFEVNWDDVHWAAIQIPDPAYLRAGENELVIWNNNLPENRKDKYLVVAHDDNALATTSFSKVGGEWSAQDLNGDREGSPRGEWMIRLKLNRLAAEQQKIIDAVGPARYHQAVEDKNEFVWGLTDAVSWVFPDRPYEGPLDNQWTIDAARNEYESCQLVIVPVSADMLWTRILKADFTAESGATIGRDAITVRLVRTARSEGVDWPDPLPVASPIDINRGRVQPFWITVHVPEDAEAGLYHTELTIDTMSTGGRDRKMVKVPLQLRVRDFGLPTSSRYQMVSNASPRMAPWQIATTSAHGAPRGLKKYLDRDGNLRLDFEEFDRNMEANLARGVDTFSIGLAYTGADQQANFTFDWRVPVEGQEDERRIWVNPMIIGDLDAKEPASRQAREWFRQYLSQFYDHLEEKGWTRYFWVYAADEPHQAKWTEPLNRFFGLIKEIAPNLRIMITKGPTGEYGPNLDVTCIMMNHLRDGTSRAALDLNQDLWCYSCGHLNNPSLTVNQTPIGIRVWFWLQDKWNVKRVLLWNTMVYGGTFHRPGADGRGDGQVFYHMPAADGDDAQFIPSIRVELLRDGVEDREYLYLLKQLTQRFADTAQSDEDKSLLERAAELRQVPDELARTQFDMTRDVNALLARRAAIADMIEQLAGRQ